MTLNRECESFLEGVWSAAVNVLFDNLPPGYGHGRDHVDIALDYMLESAPDGISDEDMLNVFLMVDEGGVIDEFILPAPEEGAPRSRVLRFVDTQAGENFAMSPERYKELTGHDMYGEGEAGE